MSGTNAHALVAGPVAAGGSASGPGEESEAPSAKSLAWKLEAVWPVARAHALVASGAGLVGGQLATPATAMRCELRLPAVHAALWDHQVQGRVLLPGTAFMEAASAGARVLLSPPASLACGVVGVVLVAPCVLGEGARGQGDMLSEGSGRRLEMHVGATGTVRVTSPSGQLHVQAGVGAGHKALPVREVVREKAGTSSILGSSWSPATRACSRAEVSCGRTSAAHQGYQVHPAAMDCALHLGVENLRAGENTGAPQVPASAGAYFSDGAISGEVRMEALAGKVGEWAGGSDVMGICG